MARSFTSTDNIAGSMVPADSAWSAGAWVYPTATTPNFAQIIAVGSTGKQFGFWDGSGGQSYAILQEYSTTNVGWHSTAGGVTTNAWQCVIGAHDGGTSAAASTSMCIYLGSLATPMAVSGSGINNAVGTKTTGSSTVSIGNRGAGALAFPGRVAQAFLVPWQMTVVEAEQFRLGDWTVLYAHGIPRFFLPLQGAGLYDLSGQF